MRTSVVILFLFIISCLLEGRESQPQRTNLYLFPGTGADFRLFKNLKVPSGYDTVHIPLPVPEKKETLTTYALRFVSQIDTTVPFVLLGVSLGGMICTELSDTLNPVRTILISSAKATTELPGRYTFQKKIRINRIVPKRMTKLGT